MKTQIKGFINYRKNDYDGKDNYAFHGCEMSEYGYVTVMPFALEVDIPESFDPRAKQVELLNKEKIKLMADFQNRVTEIERKISELTCLEAA
jgi:hypothetical protein